MFTAKQKYIPNSRTTNTLDLLMQFVADRRTTIQVCKRNCTLCSLLSAPSLLLWRLLRVILVSTSATATASDKQYYYLFLFFGVIDRAFSRVACRCLSEPISGLICVCVSCNKRDTVTRLHCKTSTHSYVSWLYCKRIDNYHNHCIFWTKSWTTKNCSSDRKGIALWYGEALDSKTR